MPEDPIHDRRVRDDGDDLHLCAAGTERRVQRGRQPGGLLRPADRHRHGDGELSDRRTGRRAVKAMGVRPFYKRFEHDGVTGPNIAAVYSDRGHGVRAPVVFYNRSNEAAARLRPGDFDWKGIFAGGVRWFHSGGIFAALSETTPELIIEGMRAAKAAGAVVSFDLNFREKLWSISGGRDRAAAVIERIVEN